MRGAHSDDAVNETSPTHERSVLAAILFTDAVGFSAYAREDEAGALEAIAADHRAMRALCAQHDGRVVKSTGDGLMMMFYSAVSAFQCGLAILRDVPHSRLRHRIGLHLGDVLASDDDVMGDGVNVASRLQELAQPGEICASQTIVDVVQSRLKFAMRPMGVQTLKNIPQPLRVYAVDPFGGEGARSHRPRWNARAFGFVFGAFALLAIGIPLWMLALRPPPPTVARNESAPVTLSPELARYLESGRAPVDANAPAPTEQTPEEQALAKKVSDLESLQQWFDDQMKAYPKEKPLTLPAKQGAKSVQVWKDSGDGVVAQTPDESTPDAVKAGTFVEATRALIARLPEGSQKAGLLRKLESLSVPRKPPTSTAPTDSPPAASPGLVRSVPLPKDVQTRIEELDSLNTVLADALKGYGPNKPFKLDSLGHQPIPLWFDADGELVGDTGDGSAAPVEMATYLRVARELSQNLPDGPQREALKAALDKLAHRPGRRGGPPPPPNDPAG